MFHPTPREAQMIEAIARAVKLSSGRYLVDGKWHDGLSIGVLVEELESLTRGGGEEITFSPAQVDAIKKNVIMPHEDNQAEWNRGYMSALKEVYRFLDSHTSKE